MEDIEDEFGDAEEEAASMDQDPKRTEKRKSPNQAELDQFTAEALVLHASRKGGVKSARTSDATHSCSA